jgi:hypothetical protein
MGSGLIILRLVSAPIAVNFQKAIRKFFSFVMFQRVTKRQAIDPARFRTFRDLLQHEKDTNYTREWESATLSLLWLKRYTYIFVTLLNSILFVTFLPQKSILSTI